MDGCLESDDRSQMESVERPRDVNVVLQVRQQLDQIVELIQAVENPTLVSGEVTKGPRTAMQRLPRHMRRRAMSYNIKRFPRAHRRFAKAAVAASKHRKKPPSRFWRRRSRNLLKSYVRRQRKNVWLETHIWHAKRFRMVNKWDHRLPLYSFQRAFRATYRDAVRHCVVRDISYLNCFQINCDDQSGLIKLLNCLCPTAIGRTFSFRPGLSGTFELPLALYHPGKYPNGLIGPIRYMWSKSDDGKCALIIFSHPTTSSTILPLLIELLDLKQCTVDSEVESTIMRPESVVDQMQLNSLSSRKSTYKGRNNIEVINLSDQLVRLRLNGPKSFAVLDEALKLGDATERVTWNEFWNNECSKATPGDLADGAILTLSVEQCRLIHPFKKRKPGEENCCNGKSQISSPIPQPSSQFWNLNVREEALKGKISQRHMEKSSSLGTKKSFAMQIPIILVVRNPGTGKINTRMGVDLIAPAGFGMDFWLALQYSTARSSGLRDHRYLNFEFDTYNFPEDVPDCEAGCSEIKEECQLLREKYRRKPRNRRIAYWAKLSIKYPFTFHYEELVRDWTQNSGDIENVCVIRDRRELIIIDKWLKGKGSQPDVALMNSLVLVPIVLEALVKGRPLRHALICELDDKDWDKMSRNSGDEEKFHLEEPSRSKEIELQKIVAPGPKTNDAESSTELEEYISMDLDTNEEPVCLDSMFPDKELLRKRKFDDKIKQKRKYARKSKSIETNEIDEAVLPMSQGSEVDQLVASYRRSCIRQVIGRIIRGNYSFRTGKGRGVGYCPLAALQNIKKGHVLFRNITSIHYHLAKISINFNSLDL